MKSLKDHDTRPTSDSPGSSPFAGVDAAVVYRVQGIADAARITFHRAAQPALAALATAALIVASASCSATSSSPARDGTSGVLGSPPVSVQPGSTSVSGRLVRLDSSDLVVNSAGREIDVRLDTAVDIWRETSVPASALEIGDDLFITGTAGAPFVAMHVWANIGRLDGVIRQVDSTGMMVEVSLRSGGSNLQRVNFSPYLQYGSADGSVKTAPGDLVVGRSISAVVYVPRDAPLRATRIW